MTLNDPANQVRIRGHEGPHPKAYHQAVFDRVQDAMEACRGVKQCQQALVDELHKIASELATPRSPLRKLITNH